MSDRAVLLTMGDACGIGPETIVKAFAMGAGAGCVVVGDVQVLRRAARLLQCPPVIAHVESCADASGLPQNCVPVLQPAGLPGGLEGLAWGEVHTACGAAAALCIRFAVAEVLQRRARALVTAPIHKQALAAAGIAFPGHTEMLQSLAQQHAQAEVPVRMMLANDELRVVLASIHVALRQAIAELDFDSVLQTIRIAHRAGLAWGQARSRIAVAGLNPHAGEGGLFGDEELRFIAPAVRAARGEGIDVHGPFAPDTVFMRARHAPGHPGEFDLVVAMTHDHGLIPVKYLGVEHGVNVTLGLPFVRTSPDHGTAFDIAGKGIADARSLLAALRMARELAPR